MKCYETGELRSYVDGELASDASARVCEHLAACGICARNALSIRERSSWVTSALVDLSVERPLRMPRGIAKASMRWAWCVVAAVLLAATGWIQISRHTPLQPTEAAGRFELVDHEAIETGLVAEVLIGPDEIPAEVVVSADGRVRAIRVVGDESN